MSTTAITTVMAEQHVYRRLYLLISLGVVSTKQFPPLGWRFALMKAPSAPSVFASQYSMWPLMATATQFSFTEEAT